MYNVHNMYIYLCIFSQLMNALCLIEYRAPSSQNYYHAHSTMYESEYPKVKKIKASVGGELIERLKFMIPSSPRLCNFLNDRKCKLHTTR